MPTHTAACAYDGWYTYTAANGREGRCYAQVWQPRAGIPVVIVTEPADNPGPMRRRRSPLNCGTPCFPRAARASG